MNIIEQIINGNFTSEELRRISKAVHEKFLLVRKQESALKVFTLSVGQRVKISGIRPKKYNGTTGELVEIKGKRVTVQLDEQFSYVGGKVSGIPISCVNQIV